MCAYDTTVVETVDPESQSSLPLCLRRDNLTSIYFPTTTRVGVLTCVLLSIVFLLTCSKTIQGGDIWHRLSVARLTVVEGAAPAAAELSIGGVRSAEAQWLIPLAAQALEPWLGSQVLILLNGIMVTLGTFLLARGLAFQRAHPLWAILGATTAFALSWSLLTPGRTAAVCLLALPLALTAAERLVHDRKALYWIPLLFAVWVNSDPSFVVGLAVLLVAFLGNLWEQRRTKPWSEVRTQPSVCRLGLALAMALVCCGMNPNGFVIYSIAIQSFVRGSLIGDISWAHPMQISSATGLMFYGSLFAGAVLVKLSPRRISVQHGFLFALMAVATIGSTQFLVAWAIIWSWITVPHAQAVWNRFQRRKMEVMDGSTRDASMRTLLVVGLIFTTLMITPVTRSLIAGEPRGIAATVQDSGPIYVAEEMDQRGLSGRIFAPAQWSDYIVWKNLGRIKPLLNANIGGTSAEVVKSYRAIAMAGPEWLAEVDKYELDYLVIARPQVALRNAVLGNMRGKSRQFRIVYQDQRCMLVRRIAKGQG